METTLEQRQKLKEFAATPLNKSVMLLAMQGCTPRQMAANLGIGHGTAQSIIIKANDLIGNDGELSASRLGESLRALQRERQNAAVERRAIINNSGDTVDVTRWDYS